MHQDIQESEPEGNTTSFFKFKNYDRTFAKYYKVTFAERLKKQVWLNKFTSGDYHHINNQQIITS